MNHFDKIEKAITNLIFNNVNSEVSIYGHLILQTRRSFTRCIPTMGVRLSKNIIQLLINPDFVNSLTLEETTALLMHEMLHIVFLDILEKDLTVAKNIAMDATINQYVYPFKLPENCINLETIHRYGKIKYDLEKKGEC